MISVEITKDTTALGAFIGHPVRGAFYVVKRVISTGFVNAECFLKCNDDRMLEEILAQVNSSLEPVQERVEVIGQVVRILRDVTPEYVSVFLREINNDEIETHLVLPMSAEIVLDDPANLVPLPPTNVDPEVRHLSVVSPGPQYDSGGYVDL